MCRYSRLAAILIIVFSLSSCSEIAQGRAEIDKLFITRVISIDEAEGGKIMVTLTTKSISTGGGGQESKETSENIIAYGETLADAHKNLIVHTDKRPTFGHTEYILFGEAIAKKGIRPYLDYISRYNEFRYNAKVYIVKGTLANSLVKMSSSSKLFVGDRLSSNEENAVLTSLSRAVSLNEVLLIFDNKNLDLFVPSVEMSSAVVTGESDAKFDVLLRGYALFNKDKLSYFTSMEEARGINWMMNRIGSGLILVRAENGEEVSLTIIKGKTKIKPEIVGNELHCKVEIAFTTNISEIMGTESLLDKKSIDNLITLQNLAIKKEVEKTIGIAQKNNSDHFSIISKFIIKYPKMRDYFMENW
ncbi:MAG: Ger(x)C family spore germination protein, partial [Pseudomonadota bacterium]